MSPLAPPGGQKEYLDEGCELTDDPADEGGVVGLGGGGSGEGGRVVGDGGDPREAVVREAGGVARLEGGAAVGADDLGGHSIGFFGLRYGSNFVRSLKLKRSYLQAPQRAIVWAQNNDFRIGPGFGPSCGPSFFKSIELPPRATAYHPAN